MKTEILNGRADEERKQDTKLGAQHPGAEWVAWGPGAGECLSLFPVAKTVT